MGLNDFWLQFNNGKKEKLNDIKHGVRKEQLSEKFQNLFDLYDVNNDGTLEKNELDIIYNNLSAFSGSDKTLDNLENTQVASIFADKVGIEDADFQGFVKSVSDATADILENKETPTSDGGKEIKTKYKDGTTETITYYPNGDFKHKKVEKKFSETTYEIVINGVREQVTEAQYHKALDRLEEEAKQKQQQKQAKPLDGHYMMPFSFTDFNNVSVNSNTKTREEIKEHYSGRYIAESLGVDLNTEDGKKIMARMNLLPEDVLIKLQDGKELKEILADQDLEPTFDNISNVMEFVFGATLRTDEEQEAYKPQREKIIKQAKITQIITQLYETIANWNEQYTESIGLFGLGAEGIGYLLNKIGVDGCNHYQMTEYYAEYAQKASELKFLNPNKFKEGFEKIYGDDSKFKYNEQAFDKLLSLIESNKAVDKDGNFTEDYKKSIEVALGLSESTLENPNDSTCNQVMNGLGEALIMIATLGWGAETKAGTTLALSTTSTFGKAGVALASKQLNNKLLQGTLRFAGQGVKLLGPMINEGTKMALYTMAEGTATNVANRTIKFDREDTLDRFLETEGAVMKGAQGSFGIGAFAGAFGTVVTSKVMQAVSKTSSKTVTALSEKFAKGAVDGNEVFATIMEKSVPTKIAEVAAFATDVLGFTAFESAIAIANNYENISPENLTEILWEEFKGQGYNLGQLKVVSHLIMMLTGSRSARMQSQRYLQDNLPQFKGVKVEQFEGKKIEKIEGVKLERPVEQYLIEMPDGRKIECKNADEMVASMYLIARGETAFSSKFDKPVEKNEYLSGLVECAEKLEDAGLSILLDICNNSISNKSKPLYQPIKKALSEMNSIERKAFKAYLEDYESFLTGHKEKEPVIYEYSNDNIFISRTLSIENLKKLSGIIDLVERNLLPVTYAKKIYYKTINGLQIVKPESKFDGMEESCINLCKQHENIIKELDQIENRDYFCKQSFELLKNNMGLEDSGINIKLFSGNEGGYYDVETNTIYINKNWAGEEIGCINNGGVKAEVFASIAHELTHARQWIEIIRNGWLEDMPEWKNKISDNPNGKYLLYYADEIGSNESSLEKSYFDFNNWCNYNEPYKKSKKDGDYLKDSNGNLIIEKNSIEYQNYYTQQVEQEAFKNGHTILSQYNRIVKNNLPRKCSTEDIKNLFKDKKIDTNNNWYKQIEEFLKTVKTDRYIINLKPALTSQDFEVIAMLVNLKNGEYIDLWTKESSRSDGIPNIQKLAMFVRTMRLTHQTLDFVNFDTNQWDIIVRGIINKPEELVLPVLKYKFSSTQINKAISDGSYKNNLEMFKIVTSIEKYLNLYTTQNEFMVYRGDLSFNMLKDVNIKSGNLQKIMEDFYESLSKIKDDKLKENKVNDFIDKIFGHNDIFITQERFLSTAMTRRASEAYADKIFWNITVSKGINGMSIESFNVERLAEAEFLIQRDVKLIVEKVRYDYKKNVFIFDASLEKVQTN